MTADTFDCMISLLTRVRVDCRWIPPVSHCRTTGQSAQLQCSIYKVKLLTDSLTQWRVLVEKQQELAAVSQGISGSTLL